MAALVPVRGNVHRHAEQCETLPIPRRLPCFLPYQSTVSAVPLGPRLEGESGAQHMIGRVSAAKNPRIKRSLSGPRAANHRPLQPAFTKDLQSPPNPFGCSRLSTFYEELLGITTHSVSRSVSRDSPDPALVECCKLRLSNRSLGQPN